MSVSALYFLRKRFSPQLEKAWLDYTSWAKIPSLEEIIGLDARLNPELPENFSDADEEAYELTDDHQIGYFSDLNHAIDLAKNDADTTLLAAYRNPDHEIKLPPSTNFHFIGYELLEDTTETSALTNCGGFPAIFQNSELNRYGLIENFQRAREIQQLLSETFEHEPHAQCTLYSLWRYQAPA